MIDLSSGIFANWLGQPVLSARKSQTPSAMARSAPSQSEKERPRRVISSLQQGVLVWIVKVEGGPVKRGLIRDFLNGDVVELLLIQKSGQGIHEHAAAAENAGIRRFRHIAGFECRRLHTREHIPSTQKMRKQHLSIY
jgi:hypothetical protein